jgi:hypothetical protein
MHSGQVLMGSLPLLSPIAVPQPLRHQQRAPCEVRTYIYSGNDTVLTGEKPLLLVS